MAGRSAGSSDIESRRKYILPHTVCPPEMIFVSAMSVHCNSAILLNIKVAYTSSKKAANDRRAILEVGARDHVTGRTKQGSSHATNGEGKDAGPRLAAMQDSIASQVLSAALRYASCSAQALGVPPCTPVERMRSTHGRLYAVPEHDYACSPLW
jgi:hypothetical protein